MKAGVESFPSNYHNGGQYSEITLDDFARSFGTTVDDIPDDCRQLIAKSDFRYEILTGEKRDKVILSVLQKIDSDKQTIGAPERQTTWQKGWEENLQDFINSGCDLNKLVPKFIRPNQPMRLNQNYIMPSNLNFELDYFRVFRLWLFKKYLKDFNSIYDFGCGSGFNLVPLARLYPKKKLYGLDFVPASVDLVNKVGQAYGWKMTGHLFDLTTPNESFQLDDNSAVLTSGAIEQLAGRFEAFIQFLLKRSPTLCINIEPTIELYDENNLVDYLAMKFHRKRGYTEGYLPRLRELEAQGKIQLLKVKRLFFGSVYMEGFTYILWRAKKK